MDRRALSAIFQKQPVTVRAGAYSLTLQKLLDKDNPPVY
jgi:hypothetical protein